MTKHEMLCMLDAKIKACTRCNILCRNRTKTVFGEGNPDSPLVWIGEGPGMSEDQEGRPFVGLAGEELNKMIAACGWKREDVYILNILKCRPPGNRRPEEDEVKNCKPFLDLQLKVINPRYIICLGNTAARTVLNSRASITSLRERLFRRQGRTILCTYHPSFVLRNPSAREDVGKDIQIMLKRMREEGYSQWAGRPDTSKT